MFCERAANIPIVYRTYELYFPSLFYQNLRVNTPLQILEHDRGVDKPYMMWTWTSHYCISTAHVLLAYNYKTAVAVSS